MSDKSSYTNDGDRPADGRRGFGDDMGTRVGRPDGAQEAPRDASGSARPGQTSTNTDAVADGLEGSIEDGEGAQQRRVQNASQGDVNPDPAAGDERPTFNL